MGAIVEGDTSKIGAGAVIWDKAWRLLRSPVLLARVQAQWKLSRALGIANMMIIHRLSDLDAVDESNSQARNTALGLLADCSTKIIYPPGEAEKTGAATGLPAAEIAQLPTLDQGEGPWKVRVRAFRVRHARTSREASLFDTNGRMSE